MKWSIYFLWVLLDIVNCLNQGSKTESTVEIHFQEGFNGDSVRVFVDDEIIFKKKLSTEAQLGYADSFELNTNANKKCLFIVNEDSLEYDFKNNCPFLRVTYSNETKIMVECSQNMFLYN